MLPEVTEALLAAARDPQSTEHEIKAAAQALFGALGQSSRSEANQALRRIGETFDMDDPSRAAFLALVCGAVIEQGADPETIADPLITRLRSLLESCAAFVEACMAAAPDAEQDSKEEGPSAREVFEAMREQAAATMPMENAAWNALDIFWRPAIAVFSFSPLAREKARDLRPLAQRIADCHEGGHWLNLMLSVLDHEPILVIEPESMTGIAGWISGVVDNFQLNMLLMDGFPRSGFLARRRIPQRVADVARGKGPQEINETVTGVWNLYTWQGIQPGLGLPDPDEYGASACWVWNEGSPEDIPVFEGRRVVLLGPRSYPRSWKALRMFDKLPAQLAIDRTLTKAEVKGWLTRMLEAKGAT